MAAQGHKAPKPLIHPNLDRPLTFHLILKIIEKDTCSPLCPTGQIHTRRMHVRVLSPLRQIPVQSHLKKITSRINAVLVQLQLVAQVRDPVPRLPHCHLPGLHPGADMEGYNNTRSTSHQICLDALTSSELGGTPFGVRRDELANRAARAMSPFLELHLRDDDVDFQHGAAVCADGIPPSGVHLDVRTTATFALPR